MPLLQDDFVIPQTRFLEVIMLNRITVNAVHYDYFIVCFALIVLVLTFLSSLLPGATSEIFAGTL